MSGIENTIIARFEKNGEHFEILVDPKKSYEYKTGVKKDFENVVAFDEVFKDAKKGERQTATAIQKAFATSDFVEIAKKIMHDGELQLTTDQRRKAIEEKRLRVIALIARNCVDPRSKAPHPPQRIEAALEQVRFSVDPFKSAEEQMLAAIEKLREILPISIQSAKIAVKIPGQFAPKAYGALKEYGLQKEEWASDGSLLVVCEMPAGMQSEFFDRLNRLTSGQAQTKVL
ncbi:MAG: ribosome assembly factor SBDS [Candidatus Micrarchaeota archaeon]|nr:ribosome assembly factor SBDS [Candidatus Micrarchaeota archaeon]